MISVKNHHKLQLKKKNQFRNTKASMQNSEYKKKKQGLVAQTHPSEKGDVKVLDRTKETSSWKGRL